MYSADDLFMKLCDIEVLINEKTKPDGALDFDPVPVMVSLELARRMIAREENIE